MMKQILSYIILVFSVTAFGQTNKNAYKFKDFDSLVIQIVEDYSSVSDFSIDGRTDTLIVRGQTAIKSEDAIELNKRIYLKESYGQSQAMTPIYDFYILYYKNGVIKESVSVSLWTYNFMATFPLKVQRQGECLCKGDGGYCCTLGGISESFKKYFLDLFKKYNLPIDIESILLFDEILSERQSDTLTYIKAWGTEPFWTFELLDSTASFKSYTGVNLSLKLIQRVTNSGFTNEYVDTYVFKSSTNDFVDLTIINHSDCSCGYDMSEGKHKTSAIIHLETKKSHLQFLGCAKIIRRQ